MEDVKLNFVERKVYKNLYSTIEKLLIVSYQYYILSCKDLKDVITYEDYCVAINERLKGN